MKRSVKLARQRDLQDRISNLRSQSEKIAEVKADDEVDIHEQFLSKFAANGSSI